MGNYAKLRIFQETCRKSGGGTARQRTGGEITALMNGTRPLKSFALWGSSILILLAGLCVATALPHDATPAADWSASGRAGCGSTHPSAMLSRGLVASWRTAMASSSCLRGVTRHGFNAPCRQRAGFSSSTGAFNSHGLTMRPVVAPWAVRSCPLARRTGKPSSTADSKVSF